MKGKLPVAYTAGLSGDEKARVTDLMMSSTTAFAVFRDIIEKRLAEINRGETLMSTYESPSWAYRQAHINGSKQAFQEVLKLLNFSSDHE